MDILTDPTYAAFTKIAGTYDTPDYVLAVQPLSKEAADTLPYTAFADEGKRKYPIHDKAHTWLAAGYLKEASDKMRADNYEFYKSRIEGAASVYGNREDVDAVFSKQASLVSPEDDDSNYGWIQKSAAGVVISRRYPMFDAYGVEKAADYFERNRFSYPIETRRTIAAGIFRKAKEHNVKISTAIEKEAGYGVPVLDTLKEEISARAALTKDAEARQAFENINVLIDASSPDELLKSAGELEATIDSLDSLNGLRRYYNVRLMSPAETVYSMSVKQAESFIEDSLPLNKHTFSLAKLAELSPEVYSILGDDFVAEVKSTDGGVDRVKLASILPTLPRPDKTLLEDHLVGLFS